MNKELMEEFEMLIPPDERGQDIWVQCSKFLELALDKARQEGIAQGREEGIREGMESVDVINTSFLEKGRQSERTRTLQIIEGLQTSPEDYAKFQEPGFGRTLKEVGSWNAALEALKVKLTKQE